MQAREPRSIDSTACGQPLSALASTAARADRHCRPPRPSEDRVTNMLRSREDDGRPSPWGPDARTPYAFQAGILFLALLTEETGNRVGLTT